MSVLSASPVPLASFHTWSRWIRRLSACAALVASAAMTAAVMSPAAQAATPQAAAPVASAPTSQTVAAENFYGSLVQQLGGNAVSVDSIMSNPEQDPHTFEASPKVARALSKADLVVYNGADYDPWIASLLSASPHPGRTEIVAATLLGKHPGDNPHLWYDPATMPSVARAVTAYLVKRNPSQQAVYQQRLTQFLASLQPIDAKIAAMRSKYSGIKVSATEPVFGYMAAAVGLDMQNERFQLAVMNGAEPSATDVAAFENGLKNKSIKVLIYNAQTSDQLSRRLLSMAHTAGVPVVPVTETEPAGKTYPQWMLDQLTLLDQALAHGVH